MLSLVKAKAKLRFLPLNSKTLAGPSLHGGVAPGSGVIYCGAPSAKPGGNVRTSNGVVKDHPEGVTMTGAVTLLTLTRRRGR